MNSTPQFKTHLVGQLASIEMGTIYTCLCDDSDGGRLEDITPLVPLRPPFISKPAKQRAWEPFIERLNQGHRFGGHLENSTTEIGTPYGETTSTIDTPHGEKTPLESDNLLHDEVTENAEKFVNVPSSLQFYGGMANLDNNGTNDATKTFLPSTSTIFDDNQSIILASKLTVDTTRDADRTAPFLVSAPASSKSSGEQNQYVNISSACTSQCTMEYSSTCEEKPLLENSKGRESIEISSSGSIRFRLHG